jgi:hypothetical protein
MTRKDYEAFAKILGRARIDAGAVTPDPLALVERITRDVARHCAHDNPRFDRERFITAVLHAEEAGGQ